MRCVDTRVRREHQSRAGNVADHRRLTMKRHRAAKQKPATWAPAVLVAAAWFGQRGEAWADDNTVHSVQNIFAPLSGPAETLDQIAILVLVICAAIFLVVGGLTVYAVVRYRRRGPQDDTSEPPQ